jgi:hypothetical protein
VKNRRLPLEKATPALEMENKMLERVVSTLESPPAQLAIPSQIAGCTFDARSWHPTPTERALWAADLTSGRTSIRHFMFEQAIWLTGANLRYAWVAMNLNTAERAELELGRVTLCALAQGRRKAPNGGIYASITEKYVEARDQYVAARDQYMAARDQYVATRE